MSTEWIVTRATALLDGVELTVDILLDVRVQTRVQTTDIATGADGLTSAPVMLATLDPIAK